MLFIVIKNMTLFSIEPFQTLQRNPTSDLLLFFLKLCRQKTPQNTHTKKTPQQTTK